MNELITKDDTIIEDMIYEIRGKQVMLDSDLAKLYECKNGTKTINLAVKRHINRFPERFMFKLTIEECMKISRFQSETLKGRGYNIKYLPYAFTEQGVAMLATVIKTEVAEEISIKIMDAFVSMRHYISNSLTEQKYINNMVLENHELIKENSKNIQKLQEVFDKFKEKRKDNEIYFNGQIFDAYYKIYEICNTAKKNLIIIDSYADNTILDIIKRLNIEVTIITKNNDLLTKQDLRKYHKQYHNLKVVYNDTFHDRYFILDNNHFYHCGTSINRIGHKTFGINLITDDYVSNLFIKKVNTIIK